MYQLEVATMGSRRVQGELRYTLAYKLKNSLYNSKLETSLKVVKIKRGVRRF